MMLVFWTLQNPKCVEAMTANKDMLEKNKEAWGWRVRFVGLSTDAKAEDVKAKVEESGWSAIEHFKETDENKASETWAITESLHCVLIDKNGNITWRGNPSDINVEAEINKLIASEMENNGIDTFINLSAVEGQLQ